jgi:hypothetical protein
MLGFEITLPPETEAGQVLRAARVAYYAAFGSGTRYLQPHDTAASDA